LSGRLHDQVAPAIDQCAVDEGGYNKSGSTDQGESPSRAVLVLTSLLDQRRALGFRLRVLIGGLDAVDERVLRVRAW
jgi:hypothetical protein